VKRLSIFRLLAVTIFSFAITMISNTLEPAVLGHKVLELVPGQRNTALGFTTFAGLIVAILVQPIVGVFSDRTRSRWGRRLPYCAAGIILVAFSLYMIALAPVFGLVVVGVLLIQLGSNTIQGPWQALIPDLVPEEQRGQASGLKAMLDILAFVVGRLVAGLLVSRYPAWGETAIIAAVTVPVVILVIALIVTALGAREPPLPASAMPQQTVRQSLTRAFAVDWGRYPAFGRWFANRTLFWGAFILLNTFLLFYLIDVVGMVEGTAQSFLGQLSTIIGGAILLVTLPSGWLADRFGRKPLTAASGIIACLGTVALLFARSTTSLTLAGLVVGSGIGIFLSGNWALVTDIVPRGEAARYLGIANIATAGGSAIARFLGGASIDVLNNLLDSTSIGYLIMYGVAAAAFLLSAVLALSIPVSRPDRK